MKKVRFRIPYLRFQQNTVAGELMFDVVKQAFYPTDRGYYLTSRLAGARNKGYLDFEVTAEEFVQFLALRADYGLPNMMQELRMEVIDVPDEPAPMTLPPNMWKHIDGLNQMLDDIRSEAEKLMAVLKKAKKHGH